MPVSFVEQLEEETGDDIPVMGTTRLGQLFLLLCFESSMACMVLLPARTQLLAITHL